MFGKHFETAEATILFVEMLNAYTNTGWQPYKFIVDVRTQSGQTFRTTVKEHFVLFNHPEVGDVVRARYDPKSQEVKLDTRGDPRYDPQAKELAQKAQQDAILSAPPGTPVPGSISHVHTIAHAPDQELDRLAQLELAEHKKLLDELLHSGSEGIATILGINEMGCAVPPLVAYLVDVQVRPDFSGAPFEASLVAWTDPRQRPLAPGNSVRVRYNPQDISRIVIPFA